MRKKFSFAFAFLLLSATTFFAAQAFTTYQITSNTAKDERMDMAVCRIPA